MHKLLFNKGQSLEQAKSVSHIFNRANLFVGHGQFHNGNGLVHLIDVLRFWLHINAPGHLQGVTRERERERENVC